MIKSTKQYKDKNLLLDTNILIYQLDGTIDISTELASAQSLTISSVTVAELYAGVGEEEYEELRDYLSSFTVLPVTESVATMAGMYKSILPKYGLRDLLIAATAQTHALTLVSANKKDFVGLLQRKPIFVKPL